MTEEKLEINENGLRTNKTKPRNMKGCMLKGINGMTSEINSGHLPHPLAPKTQWVTHDGALYTKASTWVTAENNVRKFFKEEFLQLKGKYGYNKHRETENEEDVGKHVAHYIGGYNSLTKRKHNTWNSIRKTLLEYFGLTSDIDMACEKMNTSRDNWRVKQWFPYVDFNSKNINKILKNTPEKIYSHVKLDSGETVPNILYWGAERLFKIRSGIMQYSNFLNSLYLTLWYRAKNPKVKSLFKGKLYTRPIYYFDYNLKSTQAPWGSKAGKAYPIDWSLEDLDELYGMGHAEGQKSRKPYWSNHNRGFRNVSKKWAEACDYQKILNDFEINEAITLKDLQDELFEVQSRMYALKIYSIHLKESNLYVNHKHYENLDYLTRRVNDMQSQGLKDYNEKLERLKRDKDDILRFEALKLMKGKSTSCNLEEDYTKMYKDKNKSIWYDNLVARGVKDFSKIGEIETPELVVITKEEYNRLKNMEWKPS